MDELFKLLSQLVQQIEANFDSLSDEEAKQISEFLIEAVSNIEQIHKQTVGQQATSLQPTMPQGVELLWILSGQEPNAFINYLRTYPGEGLQQLAANPQQLSQVIAHLQQTNPGQAPVTDSQGIQDTEYPSSNVSGMKYDPKSNRLLVKFHGNKGEPVYQYENVPPQIFQILRHGNAFAQTRGKNKWGEWWPMKNPSIGAAVNQYLKQGGYPYQRLS